MLYTPKIREQVRSVKVPHDFQVDIIEYDMYPPFIGLRFYESHWSYLNELERLHCIEYLTKIKQIIESNGIRVTIDPVYDSGEQKVL